MRGRTVRIYLVDGTPNGMIWAEIINWTGKVFHVPRIALPELAKRRESQRTGVYCLYGPDPTNPDRARIYIGEGDNVFKRLTFHDKDESKDFWTRAAVIISKDDNLTKAHVRYLESRLISMAVNAGRVNLSNGTAPDVPMLPEPDVDDMEDFLERVQIVLPVLGMNFLQPKPVYDATNEDESKYSPRFTMTNVGVEAYAVEMEDQFIVLKGSTARKQGAPSWDSYRSLRDSLVESGALIDSDSPEYYVFAENTAFNSPSAAATVIAARNMNGRLEWKSLDAPYQSYGDWKSAEIELELTNDGNDDAL